VLIYVASASDNRAEAAAVAVELRLLGHVVTSTWHDLPPWDRALDAALALEEQRRIAGTCLLEVHAAELVLVLGHPDMRGALFEAGYAAGLGRQLVWVGDRTATLFSSVAEERLPC